MRVSSSMTSLTSEMNPLGDHLFLGGDYLLLSLTANPI